MIAARARSSGLVLAALVLACSLAAGPEPDSELDLGWDAPGGCLDAARVRARVEGLLGRPLGEGPAVLQVEARIDHERDWQLRLTTTTADGSRTRQFHAQTCDVLADAAILAIAIAIDPTVSSRALELEPTPEPEPEPEPKPAGDDRSTEMDADAQPMPVQPLGSGATPTPARDRSALRGAVRFGAAAVLGLLPRIGPSITGAAALLLPRARAELHFDHVFAGSHVDAAGRGGEVRLWTFGLRGCWVPRVRRLLEFPVCGGAQLGPMHGRGVGPLDRREETRLLFAAANAAGSLMFAPTRHLAVGIGLEMIVPITRPGFVLDDLGLVHRVGPIGGRGWAGLEARFP